MNILDVKYPSTGINSNLDDININIAVSKIKELIDTFIDTKNPLSIEANNQNKDNLIINFENEIKKVFLTIEDFNKTRVNTLMSSIQLIKLKVKNLQNENLELIYFKDQQAKLYENEKLNMIISQKKEKDYKDEILNLKENLFKIEREKNYLNEYLNNKIKLDVENKKNSKIKFNDQGQICNNEYNFINNNFDKNEELNLLKSRLNESKQKFENEIEKNFKLNNNINYLLNQNEKFKESLTQFINQKNFYDEKIFNINNENKQFIENINKISLKLYNCDEQIDIKNKEIEFLKQETNYKSDKLIKLEKKNETLNVLLENKNNIIDDLSHKISNFRTSKENIENLSDKGIGMRNKNNDFNLQEGKINQLNEQNNFLMVRLNNLFTTNNLINKEKEILLNDIENLNENLSNNNSKQCDCKNKINGLEKTINNLNYEIKTLSEEKNEILIKNEKINSELLKFEDKQKNTLITNNFNQINKAQNENYFKKAEEKYNELFLNFSHISNLHKEKENLILKSDDINKNLNEAIQNLKINLLQKEGEINYLQKELIGLNRDLIGVKINSGDIKERNIDIDNKNNILNNQLQDIDSNKNNLEIYNDKLKIILKNKDDIISKQGGEISNLLIKIQDKKHFFLSNEEEIKKYKDKILTLEKDKRNMNKLLIKYKINIK